MNKRLLGAALFALCGGAVLALPALAQTGEPTTPSTAQTTAPSNHKSDQSSKRDSNKRSPLYGTRMCVRNTGSLIPPPKGQCLPVNGNSYSQRDLRMTGQINTAQALQMLDPSVTVGH